MQTIMQAISIDALYRHESLKLRRLLASLLDNPADAADASQETYLRMVAALSRTSVEHPTALLFRIATNVALRMRNRRRLESSLFSPKTDLEWEEIADGYALPERETIARQELRRLAQAIDELPPAAARSSCSAASTVWRTARSPRVSASRATWSRSTSSGPSCTVGAAASIFFERTGSGDRPLVDLGSSNRTACFG